MKIIGISCIGPNEKYLKECLDDFKRLKPDAVVIVGNNTDEKAEKLIKSYGYTFRRDDREWGRHQPHIKSDLLKSLEPLKPDWILAKDADELYDPELTRGKLEELARKGIGYYFYVLNFWNDRDHISKVLNFWNIRFYKFLPQFGLNFVNKRVHCGWAPPIIYKYGIYAPYLLKHYGLMGKTDRNRKVTRYEKYDPDAIYKDRSYYDHLASNISGQAYIEEQWQARVREEVSKMNQSGKFEPMKDIRFPKAPRYFYLRRLKDGATVDIPERDLEGTLKTGKFELIGEAGIENQPVAAESVVEPVKEDKVEEQPIDGMVCELCGFEARNERALRLHISKKHK